MRKPTIHEKIIWDRLRRGGGSGGGYRTLTGDIIRFMASRSAPFRKLQIALEPIQAGSGDPSPDNVRPISGRTSATVTRTGKNLVDDTIFHYSGVSRRTSGTGANELREFINSLPSGTYTVAFDAVVDAVGDSTKNWEFGFYGTSTFGTIDSIINKVNPVVGSVYRPSVTITKPDGGVINTLYLYAASTSANDLATISKFQLELGSTASAYEPYAGNTYNVTFPALGKNKFDVNKMVNTADITISDGTISVTGTAKNSTKKLSDLADLVAGETYTLTATPSVDSMNFIYLYGTNQSWYFGNQRTVTQQDLDSLVFFYGGPGTTSIITNFMIRLSSITDGSFAPYTNTVYGGTLDVLTGVLTVDRGYGQMTYSYLSGLSSDYIGYSVITGRGPMIWVRNWKYSEIAPRKSGGVFGICNASPVSIHDNDIFASQYRIYFYVGDNITSVNDFLDVVQALEANGSGLFLCYELATPIEITLTPQAINSLVGENNVWDDGTVTVEVKGEAIT